MEEQIKNSQDNQGGVLQGSQNNIMNNLNDLVIPNINEQDINANNNGNEEEQVREHEEEMENEEEVLQEENQAEEEQNEEIANIENNNEEAEQGEFDNNNEEEEHGEGYINLDEQENEQMEENNEEDNFNINQNINNMDREQNNNNFLFKDVFSTKGKKRNNENLIQLFQNNELLQQNNKSYVNNSFNQINEQNTNNTNLLKLKIDNIKMNSSYIDINTSTKNRRRQLNVSNRKKFNISNELYLRNSQLSSFGEDNQENMSTIFSTIIADVLQHTIPTNNLSEMIMKDMRECINNTAPEELVKMEADINFSKEKLQAEITTSLEERQVQEGEQLHNLLFAYTKKMQQQMLHQKKDRTKELQQELQNHLAHYRNISMSIRRAELFLNRMKKIQKNIQKNNTTEQTKPVFSALEELYNNWAFVGQTDKGNDRKERILFTAKQKSLTDQNNEKHEALIITVRSTVEKSNGSSNTKIIEDKNMKKILKITITDNFQITVEDGESKQIDNQAVLSGELLEQIQNLQQKQLQQEKLRQEAKKQEKKQRENEEQERRKLEILKKQEEKQKQLDKIQQFEALLKNQNSEIEYWKNICNQQQHEKDKLLACYEATVCLNEDFINQLQNKFLLTEENVRKLTDEICTLKNENQKMKRTWKEEPQIDFQNQLLVKRQKKKPDLTCQNMENFTTKGQKKDSYMIPNNSNHFTIRKTRKKAFLKPQFVDNLFVEETSKPNLHIPSEFNKFYNNKNYSNESNYSKRFYDNQPSEEFNYMFDKKQNFNSSFKDEYENNLFEKKYSNEIISYPVFSDDNQQNNNFTKKIDNIITNKNNNIFINNEGRSYNNNINNKNQQQYPNNYIVDIKQKTINPSNNNTNRQYNNDALDFLFNDNEYNNDNEQNKELSDKNYQSQCFKKNTITENRIIDNSYNNSNTGMQRNISENIIGPKRDIIDLRTFQQKPYITDTNNKTNENNNQRFFNFNIENNPLNKNNNELISDSLFHDHSHKGNEHTMTVIPMTLIKTGKIIKAKNNLINNHMLNNENDRKNNI